MKSSALLPIPQPCSLTIATFRSVAFLVCLIASFSTAVAQQTSFPLQASRILFLGDSNTHAGEFINRIDLQLRLHKVTPLPEIINAGLASETCSGLSEPDHPFPRPDVHERLDRALAAVKPDVVVACYGMNDGIYFPFSEERFQIYQKGINRLIEKVHASGAKLILITPPPFDALPLRGTEKLLPSGREKYAYFAVYEDYDQVMQKYAAWIMQQNDRVEMVIDSHSALTAFAKAQRMTKPDYSMAPDGVHFNADGHKVLAEVVLQAWGLETMKQASPDLEKLATERGRILHDAWLTHIGHKRPGTPDGLPLEAARKKAAELEISMKGLLEQSTTEGQTP